MTNHLPDANFDDTSSSESKNHFISPENFALLKKYQQKIYESTQVTPSLRKILNSLINDESLEIFTEKLIASLK
jgi:hypothetical protein